MIYDLLAADLWKGLVHTCRFLEFILSVCLSEIFTNSLFLLFCRLQIEESSKPVRLSQQLDKAVTTNYKPVANHQYNVSSFWYFPFFSSSGGAWLRTPESLCCCHAALSLAVGHCLWKRSMLSGFSLILSSVLRPISPLGLRSANSNSLVLPDGGQTAFTQAFSSGFITFFL